MNAQRYLAFSLLALALLFIAWFAPDTHALTGFLVFATPPILLAVAALRGWRRAGFVSAIFALLWFSHGVMTAYSVPQARGWAIAEFVLALVIVHAACLPGIRAYQARRRAR